MTSDRLVLFRAVLDAELESLRRHQCFHNPVGVERKYFATSQSGARQYAAMAQAQFGDGRYTIVATAIDPAILGRDCYVVVDRGIPTVTVPTEILYALDRPRVLEEF